jgi:hypothetical protein
MPKLRYSEETAPDTPCIGEFVAPEPVWALWRREKSLARARNQTTIPSVQRVVAETTSLIFLRHRNLQFGQMPLSRSQEQVSFQNLQQSISVPQL